MATMVKFFLELSGLHKALSVVGLTIVLISAWNIFFVVHDKGVEQKYEENVQKDVTKKVIKHEKQIEDTFSKPATDPILDSVNGMLESEQSEVGFQTAGENTSHAEEVSEGSIDMGTPGGLPVDEIGTDKETTNALQRVEQAWNGMVQHYDDCVDMSKWEALSPKGCEVVCDLDEETGKELGLSFYCSE